MGILSRFKEIMASNINAVLDKAEDPAKTLDDFMRSLNRDLGEAKAETAAVLAEERRAKRALEESQAEIAKLQRYADKAAEAGDGAAAAKFLDRKAAMEEKQAPSQAAYDLAATNAANMKQMQEKLVSDLSQLESRFTALKEKLAATKVQQKINAMGSPMDGPKDSLFDAAEEKVQTAYNEAMAIAELRAGSKNDLDKEFEQLEKLANNKKRKEQE